VFDDIMPSASGPPKGENKMADQPKLQGIVHIKVTENVTLDNLHQLITHIAGMTGCRPCGIMGVDLRLSGDPAELQQLSKLAGVKSVNFGG
jgi:hypothetical protein